MANSCKVLYKMKIIKQKKMYPYAIGREGMN